MAQAVLAFNERLDRVGEVAIVVVVGSMLSPDLLTWRVLWLAPVLFLIVRPLSVLLGLTGAGLTRPELALSSWFGVRHPDWILASHEGQAHRQSRFRN